MAHMGGCGRTGYREVRYPDGTRLWVCDDCACVRLSRPPKAEIREVQIVGGRKT